MKMNCSVTIVNRLTTNLGMKCDQKFKNAILAVMKVPKEDAIYLLLITSKNKNGARYKIRGNIEKTFSQFKHEGKTTIRFIEPAHDLMIKADKIHLSNFLMLIKKIHNCEVNYVDNSLNICLPGAKVATNKMHIRTKSEYPLLQGFPSNLQILTISNCHLKKVDSRILKLKNLTTLYLDKNNLTEIPLEFNKLPLKQLSLSYNKLGRNFQSWNFLSWPLSQCLEYLNLSGNEMKYFPSSLVRFHKLKILKLSNIEIGKIPFRIFLLPNLQELDVSKNFLLALPGTITKRLKKFDRLDISENESFCYSSEKHILNADFSNDYVPSLLEFSIRSIQENRIFYGETTLPRHLIPLLDQTKLCLCGKFCCKDFGSVYKTADSKELATTIISSHHISTVPIVFQICCPNHMHFINK